jgi:hypothetical protein
MNGERLRQTEHIICNIDNQVMVMTKDLYPDFLDRRLQLTRKLLNKGFLVVNLKSSFRKSLVITITWLTKDRAVRTTLKTGMKSGAPERPVSSFWSTCNLVEISIPKKFSLMICSVCRNLSPFMTYHRICSKSNTTGGTCGLISLRLGFRRNFM